MRSEPAAGPRSMGHKSCRAHLPGADERRAGIEDLNEWRVLVIAVDQIELAVIPSSNLPEIHSIGNDSNDAWEQHAHRIESARNQTANRCGNGTRLDQVKLDWHSGVQDFSSRSAADQLHLAKR